MLQATLQIKLKALSKSLLICSVAALMISCGRSPEAKYANQAQVKSVWSTKVGSGTRGEYLKLQPALADNIIYADDVNGNVFAVNATNGHHIWHVSTETPINTGVAVGQSNIFVGTDMGENLAIVKANGAPAWYKGISNVMLASPAAGGNLVIAKTENSQIYAFNQQTGNLAWNWAVDAPSLILRASSSPIIVGQKAVMGLDDGEVAALDMNTGNVIWRQQIAQHIGGSVIQQMVDVDATPAVSNGVVYAATYQGNIAAMNLSSGRVMWKRPISTFTGITVGNDDVFATTADGKVLAYTKDSGAVAWQQLNLNKRDLGAPAAIGNYVAVGDDKGNLYFLSQADGHIVSVKKVGKKSIIAAPVVQGNQLFVQDTGGRLKAYRVV